MDEYIGGKVVIRKKVISIKVRIVRECDWEVVRGYGNVVMFYFLIWVVDYEGVCFFLLYMFRFYVFFYIVLFF